MAKSTDERIAAALGEGARIADVNVLIRDLQSEIGEAEAEAKRLDDLSIAITTKEADAEQAADDATKARRRSLRLAAKVAALDARVKELEESNRRKVAEAAYAAAKKTRDALAKEISEAWPKLTSQMIDLFERIEASDAECKQVGSCYGKSELASAETLARGCEPNFMVEQPGISWTVPVNRITRTKLQPLNAADPLLTHHGIWPRFDVHAA